MLANVGIIIKLLGTEVEQLGRRSRNIAGRDKKEGKERWRCKTRTQGNRQ